MSRHAEIPLVIRAELASELAAARADEFGAAVTMHDCEVSSSCASCQLRVVDSDTLLDLLGNLAADLAGSDWAEGDDAFEELCLEGGLPYADIMKPPARPGASAEADLRKKELGDLGELLALLHAIAHLECDPALAFSKNAIKLYERVSEPGIDVLCFSMDLDSDVTDELLPDDEVLIIESKVGLESYRALSNDATEYFDVLGAHQWQRELRLVQASLNARGAKKTARRIRWFLPGWPDEASTKRLAFLVSDRTIEEPVDLEPLDVTPQCGASLMRIEPDNYREKTFAYRRRDDD